MGNTPYCDTSAAVWGILFFVIFLVKIAFFVQVWYTERTDITEKRIYMENSNLFSTLPEGFRLGTEEDASLVTLTIAQAFADYNYPIPSVEISHSALLRFFYAYTENVVKNTLKYGTILTNDDFSAIMLLAPLRRMAPYDLEALYGNVEKNAGKKAAENMRKIFEYVEEEFAMLNLDDRTIYVEEFAVQTPRQGQKLGSKLMRELFRQCEDENRDVFLYTNTLKNQAIYNHFGFETIRAVHEENLNSDTYFLLRKANR